MAGFIVEHLLQLVYKDPVMQTSLTIVTSYLVFYMCSYTKLETSGILALVSLGLYMTRSGQYSISASHSVHTIWQYLAFTAETIIFLLAGVIIGSNLRVNETLILSDYLMVIPLYFILMILRFIGLTLCYPILKRIGYGMDFK